VSLQPSCYRIISKRHGGYPVSNLLATCVTYIANETSNDIVHSHIEIALFISMTLSIFVFPFFINRNDYWIVGYWLSTYVCWCCMN